MFTTDASIADQQSSHKGVRAEPTEATGIFVLPPEPTTGAEYLSMDDIAGEQIKDPDIGPIYAMLVSSPVRPAWDAVSPLSEASKVLWRQWLRLSLTEGVIKRRYQPAEDPLGAGRWQLVLPASRRRNFIHLVHSGLTGGHLGLRRTMAGVALRAYWPGWTSNVKQELRRCDACAQYHRGATPKTTSLKPFLAGESWETISIDITGPHPRSLKGYVYMLTVYDHFSKWAEALPIRNHTAPVVATALFTNVLLRFGMP